MNNGFQQCVVGSVILVVYVNDILLISNDTTRIMETKEHLKKYFITKDIRRLIYFLGIKFTHGKDRMTLSQKKYALDLFQETRPVDQSSDFWTTSNLYKRWTT